LIVVSHPNAGDPFNSSKITERLASYGYIVAAPFHNGDTQDDVRNRFHQHPPGAHWRPALPRRLPGPCTDVVLGKSMQDRALDISAVIHTYPVPLWRTCRQVPYRFLGLSRDRVIGDETGG